MQRVYGKGALIYIIHAKSSESKRLVIRNRDIERIVSGVDSTCSVEVEG